MGLQLAAQLHHVDFQRVGKAVEVLVPDVVVNPRSRQHLTGMAQEEREQCQLLGRQVERLSRTLCPLSGEVNAHVAVRDRQVGEPLASTEQRADPSQELLE